METPGHGLAALHVASHGRHPPTPKQLCARAPSTLCCGPMSPCHPATPPAVPSPSGDRSSADLSLGRDGGDVLPSDSDAEMWRRRRPVGACYQQVLEDRVEGSGPVRINRPPCRPQDTPLGLRLWTPWPPNCNCLTSSLHAVDVCTFCGQSVLTGFAAISLKETIKGALARTRLDLAHGAAAGVAAGKAQHVAHNDVNPANVVAVNRRTKLNDFNVAKFLA